MEFTRRNLIGAAGATAATAFTRTALGGWEPSERHPDHRLADASVERLATGMRWCEGPVYFGDARRLLWSDIPNNRIMRWDEGTGRVGVYRRPSNFANGNTRDRQGRLVSCEHDSRRVTRTEYDTVLIDTFDRKPLNSPNDIVVKSDDSIWFTDPPFGILGNYEGHVATPELPTNVYRLDPKSGRATVVAGDVNRPNGLAFSPDEKKLYIVEAGVAPRVIRVYDVNDDKLANDRTFITAEPGGTPDGPDVDGTLWCGWGMGRAPVSCHLTVIALSSAGGISAPEAVASLPGIMIQVENLEIVYPTGTRALGPTTLGFGPGRQLASSTPNG